MKPYAKQNPAPPAEKVQKQLQRILTSPEFQATDRQREFLQFVITETIAGRVNEIKGYTVATQVFGRKEDFDQATDPIVSIQANKLRRSLERYYLVAGQQDPVRIDIPKGTYVPTFCEQIGIESDTTARSSKSPKSSFEGSWPTVLVRPFQNWTGDPGQDYLGLGLATELVIELTRYQDIRVLMQNPVGYGKRASDSVARFVIDGSVRKDAAGIKVAVHLIDSKNSTQIWADTHQSNLEASQLIAFQEEIAQVIAVKIAGEHGIITMTLSHESRSNPPSDFKTYEAILRYYEYDLTTTAESFIRALEALKHAADIEPECCQIWSMLGRLYSNNYCLEFFDMEMPLQKAVAYAEKGVQLNPEDQRARAILAFCRMLSNDLPAGLAEAEKALSLNPNSLFFMDTIGYLFTLMGEWERGPALIRKAIELNSGHHSYALYALWLDWFRQEKYEQARLETLGFRTPGDFWDSLARAATFGELRRYQEGKQAVRKLLHLKPDFPTRGMVLIKHYIKFEDIVERTIDGLSKVGLKIE